MNSFNQIQPLYCLCTFYNDKYMKVFGHTNEHSRTEGAVTAESEEPAPNRRREHSGVLCLGTEIGHKRGIIVF